MKTKSALIIIMFFIVMGSVSAISGFFIDLQPSQAAQLANTNMEIVDDYGASILTAGAYAHAKVTFTTIGQLPTNGKIRVRFPNGFGLDAISGANCTNMIGGYMTQSGFMTGTPNTLLITRSGDGSILPFGTTITCTISVVTNPGAGNPGNYQIETLQSDGTLTAGTIIDADYAVAGDTFTATSLTNISVEHDNAPRLGKSGTVTIRFTSPTNLFFALTSKILVTAPGYDTQYAGNYNSVIACSTMQIGFSGGPGGEPGTLILSGNGGSSEGLTSEVCTISNITTPSSPNSNVSYIVQIQNANNQMLGQGTGTGSNFSIATFSAASVSIANANAEGVGNVTVNFTTQETLSNKVEIIFPTGFTFNAGANNANTALISGSVGGAAITLLPGISVDTTTRTITINNPAFNPMAPNQVSFVFSNMKNPASATNTTTGNFQIKLYVNNTVVEQKTDIAGVALTGVPNQTTSTSTSTTPTTSTTSTSSTTPSTPTASTTPTTPSTTVSTPSTSTTSNTATTNTTGTSSTSTPALVTKPISTPVTDSPKIPDTLTQAKLETEKLQQDLIKKQLEEKKQVVHQAPEDTVKTPAAIPEIDMKKFSGFSVKKLKIAVRDLKAELKELTKDYKTALLGEDDKDIIRELNAEFKFEKKRIQMEQKLVKKELPKAKARETKTKKKK